MKKMIAQQVESIKTKYQPQIKNLQNKWTQLQDREKVLVVIMSAFLSLSFIYLSLDAIVKYKNSLQVQVNGLNQFVLYANQASDSFKGLSKLEGKSFTTPSAEQVKADVTQITSLENPMVNLQDGQLTISLPEVTFNQAMMIQDQLRRSYGVFADQLTITRLKKEGYVSFTAIFWVN